ncbi:MAG: uroporphyrinogen-III C-methyltransferase, partial [Pseudomonadota bacterium]
VAQRIAPSQRRAFWAWVFRWGRARFATGAPDAARQAIRTALDTGRIPGDTARRISLIEVSPGASDLLTLRAVARLQEADLIVHDSHTDPEVLELARRDAERAAVPCIGDIGPITGKVAGHDVIAILSGPSDAAGLLHKLGAAGLDVERIPAAAVAPRQVWRLAG